MGNLLDLFVFKYSRTDFHELNLDWLISDVRTLAEILKNFININTIKYADPIQWNITKQYEANTVVIDGNTGTAYLSVQPVPSGVALSNTDYWTVIFTLDILSANQNLTLRDDGANVLATFASVEGDWLLWNGTLYRVKQNISVNEAYVAGYNLDRYTVEMFINDYITAVRSLIGSLSDLATTDKTDLVAAINELVTVVSNIELAIGDLNDLDTTDKSSVVNAVNEVYAIATDAVEDIYYINVKDFGAAGDGVTDDSQAFIDAVNSAENKTCIVIPDGTYVINSTVNITKSNIYIMGASKASIITGTANPIFKVGNGSARIDNVYFTNFTVNTSANTTVFDMHYAFNTLIEGIKLTDCYTFANYGADADVSLNIWSVIRNCIGRVRFRFCTITAKTNGVNIENCQINSEEAYNAIFLRVSGTTDTIVLRNNLVQRFAQFVLLDVPGNNGVIQNAFISQNIVDTLYSDVITVNAVEFGTITRLRIIDNWLMTNGSHIITLTTSSGTITQVAIKENILMKAQDRAILVQGTRASGLEIDENTFDGFNLSAGATINYGAVCIFGATTKICIRNNNFSPVPNSAGSNRNAIVLVAGCENFIIVGNNFIGVTTPITDNSGARNKIIANNLGVS